MTETCTVPRCAGGNGHESDWADAVRLVPRGVLQRFGRCRLHCVRPRLPRLAARLDLLLQMRCAWPQRRARRCVASLCCITVLRCSMPLLAVYILILPCSLLGFVAVWPVVSCRVVSCRVVSCRVVSCRVVSCRVVSGRAVRTPTPTEPPTVWAARWGHFRRPPEPPDACRAPTGTYAYLWVPSHRYAHVRAYEDAKKVSVMYKRIH